MAKYKLKRRKIGSAVISAYKTIEGAFEKRFLTEDGELKVGSLGERAVSAYSAVEKAAVGGYKAVETAAVSGYKKIEKAFEDRFLEKVEDDEE